MVSLSFQQVDVFSAELHRGNPLAVVVGADGLSDEQMARFANWTNLSETTFLLQPTVAGADYRVRIFTPWQELPFAGHPTLGSCHVWLAGGGKPLAEEIVQECAAGLIRIRNRTGRLAFAAPPLVRTGPVEADVLKRIARGLALQADAIVASQWICNGPPWVAVMLRSRAEVLQVKPDDATLAGMFVGVAGPWEPARDGSDAQFEVRGFIPGTSIPEDPVTGSLNAGLAQWLIGSGLAPASYTARQGTALGRKGQIYIEQIGPDTWIGGDVVTCIEGVAQF